MKLATQKTADRVRPHQITDAELGREVQCPVTKLKVKIIRETPSVEYKGKVYYFCCNDCPKKFRRNPEKYAGK